MQGTLSAIGTVPTDNVSPSSVAVDRSGRYVYVANHDGNTVSIYEIKTDGTLMPITGPPIVTGTWPISIAIGP